MRVDRLGVRQATPPRRRSTARTHRPAAVRPRGLDPPAARAARQVDAHPRPRADRAARASAPGGDGSADERSARADPGADRRRRQRCTPPAARARLPAQRSARRRGTRRALLPASRRVPRRGAACHRRRGRSDGRRGLRTRNVATARRPTGAPGRLARRRNRAHRRRRPHGAQLDQIDGALTGCTVAIAETGTIVLTAGPAEGRRALTLVPDLHICVVTSGRSSSSCRKRWPGSRTRASSGARSPSSPARQPPPTSS